MAPLFDERRGFKEVTSDALGEILLQGMPGAAPHFATMIHISELCLGAV
jgi:hypothetical protein